MKYLNSIIEFMRDGNSDIMIRIGNGYDVHVLTEGRKLVLGGVEIPHTKGVLGHSDGDVLVHAVMDAMLGALALGDIGKHFPDTDMKYENIDSTILLKRVKELIAERGYKIINLDSIIVLQKPKVKPYRSYKKKNCRSAGNRCRTGKCKSYY